MRNLLLRFLLVMAMTGAGAARGAGPNGILMIPDGFNGVILAAPDRQAPAIIHAEGFADLAAGRRFDERTQSQIGSASKFLTSLVVLRLVEQGKLALDGPIGTWLPFLPEATARQATLRHLLSNTSGIPNGVMDSYRQDAAFTMRDIPAREAAELWGKGELKFTPGTDWDYSLTNWVLVRAVVEQATGKDFVTVLQEELVAPLGLRDTGIPGPEYPQGDADAQAYASLDPVKTRTNKIPPYAAASGTIYSSATDLRRIMNAVFDDGYLSPASRRELTKVHFEREGYALGGRVIDLPGTSAKLLSEPGETSSYRALVVYEPDSGACVVMLNNTGMGPDALANAAKEMLRRMLVD